MRAADQFLAYALSLERSVDREIRKVGAVSEVRDGAGNAHEQCITARRHDDIRIPQHRGDSRRIVDRTTLVQSGTA